MTLSPPAGEGPFADSALLPAFRAGEARALTAVYRAYVRDVGNLVRCGFTLDRSSGGRVLGVATPAEQAELVQEVFVRAFAEKARASYDPRLPYRPYLLRIAKNLMIDRLRKSGREITVGISEDGVSEIDRLLDENQPVPAYAEDDVDGRRLTDATRSFLTACPEDLRHFIELRFQEGLSQAEVALRLSVTRRFVRTAEERARAALANHLNAQGLTDTLRQRAGLEPNSDPTRGPSAALARS